MATDNNYHVVVTTTGSDVPRSRLGGCPAAVCVLGLCTCLLTVALIAVTALHSHYIVQEEKVCRSVTCNSLAARLLQAMDPTIDPCQNFAKYTCGGYQSQTPFGPYDFGERRAVNDKMKTVVDVLHESLYYYDEFNRSDFVKYPWKIEAAKFYRSCYNTHTNSLMHGTDYLRKQYRRQLRAVFQRSSEFFSFGPLTTPDKAIVRWSRARTLEMALAQFIGHDMPLGINFVPKVDNTRRGVCNGSETAALAFYPSSWASSKSEKIHKMDAKMVLAMLGATSQLVGKIATLHDNLDTYYSLSNYTEELLTGRQLRAYFAQNFGNSDAWKNFLSTLRGSPMTTADIVDNTLICVISKDKITEVINKLRSADPQTVIGYGIINSIMRISPMLPMISKFINARSIRTELTVEYSYAHDFSPADNCIGFLSTLASYIPSRIFFDYYMKNLSKKYAYIKKITDLVKNSYKRVIKNSEFSNSVKQQAINEVEKIKLAFGLPSAARDDRFISEIYKGLSMGDDYIENLVHLMKYPKRDFAKQFISGNGVSSPGPVTQVSAFYNKWKNGVFLSLGLLLPPFFSEDIPQFLNLGGLGSVIAHEITHGVISRVNFSVTAADRELFNKKSKYIVEQFDGYKVYPGSEEYLNGTTTLSSNIADLISIQVSYSSLKESSKKYEYLPGLTHLSNEQLFFVMYGQYYCARTLPSTLKNWKKFNPEFSPPDTRIMASLRNLVGFSDAFSCKKNSYMNINNKILFW